MLWSFVKKVSGHVMIPVAMHVMENVVMSGLVQILMCVIMYINKLSINNVVIDVTAQMMVGVITIRDMVALRRMLWDPCSVDKFKIYDKTNGMVITDM